MTEPRYKNDCDKCVFLGEYTRIHHFDLYIYPNDNQRLTLLIARYGNESAQYLSSPLCVVEREAAAWGDDYPLVQVLQRAREQDLIPDTYHLELTGKEIELIHDCLSSAAARYLNMPPVPGLSEEDHANGRAWAERYTARTDALSQKITEQQANQGDK